LQWVEDEEVEKTQAKFHQKPQPYNSMGRTVDLHSGDCVLKQTKMKSNPELLEEVLKNNTIERL